MSEDTCREERDRKNTYLSCRAIRYNRRSVYRQASQRKMPSYFYYSSCRSFLPSRRSSSPPRHRPHQWIRRWILCWMPKRVIFLTLPDPSSTPLPLVFPPRFSDPRNCPTSSKMIRSPRKTQSYLRCTMSIQIYLTIELLCSSV